jgi:hypothetical protein
VRLAPTIVELDDEDVFGDNTGKARRRRDAINNFENVHLDKLDALSWLRRSTGPSKTA